MRRDAFSPSVLGLGAVLCLTLLPSASYAAALPLVQSEWGLTAAEAGLVFSAYQIGYVAATLVLLPLTDRLDARRVLIVASALSAAANVLFPFWAQGLASAIILRFLAGLALVGVYMPGLRIVAESYPSDRRGGPIGLYVFSFYLGTSLSVLVTGLLLPLGWREAYLATAGLAAVAPLVAWASLRHRALTSPRRASGRLDVSVLGNRAALLVIVAYAAHTWELYAARGWIAPFLAAALIAQGGGRDEATALGATIAGAAFALGSFAVAGSGFVSDRFGRSATAALFLTASAVCSLTVGWLYALPWWCLFALTFLYGLFIGPDSPIYSTAITELAGEGKLGSLMAMQSFIGFVTSIIGPVAVGLVLDAAPTMQGWGLGFGLSGAIALLGVSALLALRRQPGSLGLANGKR